MDVDLVQNVYGTAQKFPYSSRAILPDIFRDHTRDWIYEFNNNGTLHYILMVAGEYDAKTDRLQDHKDNRIMSADVVDFTQHKIVKSVYNPLTFHPKLERGCGENKGCFGYPYGCVEMESCTLLATFNYNEQNRIHIQMQVCDQHKRPLWKSYSFVCNSNWL